VRSGLAELHLTRVDATRKIDVDERRGRDLGSVAQDIEERLGDLDADR
jgi:hypothetical protein